MKSLGRELAVEIDERNKGKEEERRPEVKEQVSVLLFESRVSQTNGGQEGQTDMACRPQEIGGFLGKEAPDGREQGQSGENKPGVEESNDTPAEKAAFPIVSVNSGLSFLCHAHPNGNARFQ
jgi:hypothetical protein